MLRVYLRFIAAGCLLGALAIWLAAERGESLPDRAAWVDLGFSSCALPCWGDIIVGETAFDINLLVSKLIAVLPVEQTRMVSSTSQINLWVMEGDQTPLSIFLYYTNGIVGDLRLVVAQPIGQLVRRLGTPDCTWIEDSGGWLRLMVYWETRSISTGAMIDMGGQQRLSPETPIISMWISATSSACDQQQARPWFGFANRQRYLAAS
jgi:hypothetical protein